MASGCRRMRGSISYQQPSTVSGEAHLLLRSPPHVQSSPLPGERCTGQGQARRASEPRANAGHPHPARQLIDRISAPDRPICRKQHTHSTTPGVIGSGRDRLSGRVMVSTFGSLAASPLPRVMLSMAARVHARRCGRADRSLLRQRRVTKRRRRCPASGTQQRQSSRTAGSVAPLTVGDSRVLPPASAPDDAHHACHFVGCRARTVGRAYHCPSRGARCNSRLA